MFRHLRLKKKERWKRSSVLTDTNRSHVSGDV
jgi:hypothetical protein